MMRGITVEELKQYCEMAIVNGHGKKHIMISCDEEGNHYYPLYYEFICSKADLREFKENGAIDREVDLDSIVLLG